MKKSKLLLFLIFLLLVLSGCGNNTKKNTPDPTSKTKSDSTKTTTSKSSTNFINRAFDAFNKSTVREVECYDKTSGITTIQTADDNLSAFFKAINSVNANGAPISDSQIYVLENEIEYLYYQTDVYNEDGSLNEACQWHKKQDVDKSYTTCQSATTLSLVGAKTVSEDETTTIDNVPVIKITVVDANNLTITYYFNKNTKLPVQAETDTSTYFYRIDKECLFFTIPDNFSQD